MNKIICLPKIRASASILAQMQESEKNIFIKNLINELKINKKIISSANQTDIKRAIEAKLSPALIQRLTFSEIDFKHILIKLSNLQNLKSPVGTTLEKKRLKNKIILKKISVPIGVILVIFEARPEVALEVAALCVKTGNVAILKGGSEALCTNNILYHCISTALRKTCMTPSAITFIFDKHIIADLLKQQKYLDLVIARGNYSMVKKIIDISKVPVLAHASGGARIYVDKDADLSIAPDILLNSKISKPAACNSLDTILIHSAIPDVFIRDLIKRLKNENVRILGDSIIARLANVEKTNTWNTEFLDLCLSIKIVRDIGSAISFINHYSKKHSEGIISQNRKSVDIFSSGIDSAALFINCSTRFHDGYEFGLGAEMGIATGKLHARGPVGLKELTTYKWQAYGNGQIRL